MISTDPIVIRVFKPFLNLAENDNGSKEADYKTIYRYNDGNNKRRQVTLGRGFTQDGGALWKVLARYIAKEGKEMIFFSRYAHKMSDSDLWQDSAFLKMLGNVSTEPAMREAQEEIFDEVYLNPALAWANNAKFVHNLSVGVVVDSYLHSGGMIGWLMNRFPEHTPKKGGDEKKWITEYCDARLDWFANSSGLLKTCKFRPLFFLRQIEAENWSLGCPLNVIEKGRIC